MLNDLKVDHAQRARNIAETQLGFLQGKVLTVIDASIASATQCKAVKDLIKDAFRKQGEHIYACLADEPSLANSIGSGTATVGPVSLGTAQNAA